MDELTAAAKARAEALWQRLDAAQRYPTGTWAQVWIPGVCPHDDVRCTHGDEIIARRFRRRLCMTCGRVLRGDLPDVCWFTGVPHSSVQEAANG
ncbi:hypothetical protein FJY71_08420 [candidate division WOR-3 bacterium]|nr:hypothetical protein [candidate division WOR-3 bacterium]